MAKFIVSTDSSSDLCVDYLVKNNVYCIVMKRVENGKEIAKIYNSEKEFDDFYEQLKKGALPSTTQLNAYEFEEYFEKILQQAQGDILHISLSSGLSGTFDNALSTANEINKRLVGRKIYVLDSLVATGGIAMLIDKAVQMRDQNQSILDTILRVEQMRDHQQGWAIVGNLFHLKRGGRISGFKATMGTILAVKPIIAVTKSGRLAIENTIKGNKKAISYVLKKIQTLGVEANKNFFEQQIYVLRTSKSSIYNDFLGNLKDKYPSIKVRELIVGSIVGTHLGDGCVVVLFEGAKRPDI